MSDFLVALARADLGYRGRAVLSGVDCAVRAGEVVAVIGPNGGGKSTLLRGFLGSLVPLAGERRAAAGLRLGYVPQELELDRELPLSTGDVVTMGTWGRAGAAMPVEEALARVGLTERRRSRFADLSGGQKQRVLLARALVGGPQLLLLDEPVSGVDATALAMVHGVLAEAARAGTAVVIVTHHPAGLRGLAGRVLEAAGGTLRELEPGAAS